MLFAGKHQCRALAESMYSPSEGLKEINHQLSTGVAQELIHFCNSLGQGSSDFLPPFALMCLCAVQKWRALSHQHAFCHSYFTDGDLDSLLDSATVDNSELSPLSSCQESAEERNPKSKSSPKDAQSSKTQGAKDSPSTKGGALSPKDTCTGKTKTD